ncbi:hypothetical protein BG015_006645 [Linnemannia schmuckeri]|uniref:F-box domain-containing protein n=1 Tax=Linnemannia schmuckeri TaxID=64567 RepID=A0A9P5S8Q2_9FUNG|nr:hypothetical protein BG015_006645 [Linnemannia schmuckeri]
METLLNPRTYPIDIPEILHYIFLHLDRPSLDICAKVSRFWRALSLDVAAHSFIPSKDILEYLAQRKEQDTKESGSSRPQDQSIADGGATATASATGNKSQAAQEFHRRCAGLRSLTIGDAWSGKKEYGDAFDIGKVVQWESAVPGGLTNLVRLDVRLVCTSQPSYQVDSLPNKVFQDILAQNPMIEELYYASGQHHPGYRGLRALLYHPLQHLRCLTLQLTNHAWNFLEFWIWLVQRDKLQERLRKEHPIVLASLRDTVPHTQKQRAAALRMLPNWNLEELTIRNANPKEDDFPFHGFLRNVLYDDSAPIYELSLRSLTLEGFDMRQYAEPKHRYGSEYAFAYGYEFSDDEPNEINSVLYHLFRRLPLLERLRISPDHAKIREPSPLPVQEIIRTTLFKLHRQGWLSPPWRLSEDLKRFCPHLRAIDLSHQRELDSSHWEDLLKCYAPRLESLVCWSVSRVRPKALRHLVPASPGIVLKNGPCPSQNWVGLQELDINANRECASVVHLFLKYVPTLRILRALGVPVDGASLLGSDWACKDMEILAINIMVPTRVRARILGPWCWSNFRNEWDTPPKLKDMSNESYRKWLTGDGESILDALRKLDSSDQPRMGHYEEGEIENEDRYSMKLWQRREAAVGYKEREKKKERLWNSRHHTREDTEFLRWCEQQDSLEDQAFDAEMERWKVQRKKVKAERDRRNKEYNTQVQQQLCQQLGRLVKLRELTLEGRQYTGRTGRWCKKSVIFDCLHLTLETGLDYLRPLQANLEKLVVYQLGERLSGGAEVEWIAKNWVHHADPVWQHTFDTWGRQSYLEIPEEEEGGSRVLYPSSKFRQLIGVHTRKWKGLDAVSAAGNIAWLEYYCPELVVVRDDTKAPKAKDSDDDLESDDSDY